MIERNDKVYFRNTIIALFFTLLFVVCIGATLAMDTERVSSGGTMVFNKRIDVTITDENGQSVADFFDGDRTIWPGCIITGVTLATQVSREGETDGTELAYVRAKIEITTGEDEEKADDTLKGLIHFIEQPNGDTWYPVDFSQDKDGSDIWYVLCKTSPVVSDSGETKLKYTARPAKQNENIVFVRDMSLVVEKSMDNTYAGLNLNITFTSQALQCANIDANTIFDMDNNGDISSSWWSLPSDY